MKQSYFVKAMWDAEARVWVSETNIPGLVIEADTLAEFEQLLFDLAPQMLSANTDIQGARIPLEFHACAHRELAVA